MAATVQGCVCVQREEMTGVEARVKFYTERGGREGTGCSRFLWFPVCCVKAPSWCGQAPQTVSTFLMEVKSGQLSLLQRGPSMGAAQLCDLGASHKDCCLSRPFTFHLPPSLHPAAPFVLKPGKARVYPCRPCPKQGSPTCWHHFLIRTIPAV